MMNYILIFWPIENVSNSIIFLAPTELKKCKLPSVRVIVRFMCYKGFKGCCKGQEQSRGAKKGQEGPRRIQKVQEDSRRFKKVQ